MARNLPLQDKDQIDSDVSTVFYSTSDGEGVDGFHATAAKLLHKFVTTHDDADNGKRFGRLNMS